MAIVKESEMIKHLTVPPQSLSPAEYENAIQAMVERQPYGTGMAVNFGSTVYVKGEKPNRIWTNKESDLVALHNDESEEQKKHSALFTKAHPDTEELPKESISDVQSKIIAELKAELAAMKSAKEEKAVMQNPVERNGEDALEGTLHVKKDMRLKENRV